MYLYEITFYCRRFLFVSAQIIMPRLEFMSEYLFATSLFKTKYLDIELILYWKKEKSRTWKFDMQ